MKIKIIYLFLLSGLLNQQLFGQQQFVQTVTTRNTSCNNHCSIIDAAEFNSPSALIFASPVLVNASNSSSNPIGALYRTSERKWSIYNLNGAPMVIGTTFNLEYFPNQDANHFVFIVPPKVRSNETVYIDHEGMNNNPNAQIRIFPSNPTTGNAVFNVYEVEVIYAPSVSKWILANKNGVDMPSGVAFNVMFSGGGPTIKNANENKDLNGNIQTPATPLIKETNANENKDLNGKVQTPVTNSSSDGSCNCIIPKSLPPDSAAGGDLGGTYPSPTVTKLYGRDLSSAVPETGQVLTWSGTAWEPKFDKNYGNQILSPYFLTFRQTASLDMKIPNVDKALIEGLDHQSFILSRTSDIVFYTTIRANVIPDVFVYPSSPSVDVWINIRIYNSSDVEVGKASNRAVIGATEQTMVAIGGIHNLPDGTYHTSVTMNRGLNGSEIFVHSIYGGFPGDQGGEMFIEVFPHNDH